MGVAPVDLVILDVFFTRAAATVAARRPSNVPFDVCLAGNEWDVVEIVNLYRDIKLGLRKDEGEGVSATETMHRGARVGIAYPAASGNERLHPCARGKERKCRGQTRINEQTLDEVRRTASWSTRVLGGGVPSYRALPRTWSSEKKCAVAACVACGEFYVICNNFSASTCQACRGRVTVALQLYFPKSSCRAWPHPDRRAHGR